MNIAMAIFAFIGIIFTGCLGIFLTAIIWFIIQEKREEKQERKKNG